MSFFLNKANDQFCSLFIFFVLGKNFPIFRRSDPLFLSAPALQVIFSSAPALRYSPWTGLNLQTSSINFCKLLRFFSNIFRGLEILAGSQRGSPMHHLSICVSLHSISLRRPEMLKIATICLESISHEPCGRETCVCKTQFCSTLSVLIFAGLNFRGNLFSRIAKNLRNPRNLIPRKSRLILVNVSSLVEACSRPCANKKWK